MKNVLQTLIDENLVAGVPDIMLTQFAHTSRVGELVTELTSELLSSTSDTRDRIMQRVNALCATLTTPAQSLQT